VTVPAGTQVFLNFGLLLVRQFEAAKTPAHEFSFYMAFGRNPPSSLVVGTPPVAFVEVAFKVPFGLLQAFSIDTVHCASPFRYLELV
jgi:hypothetical protein